MKKVRYLDVLQGQTFILYFVKIGQLVQNLKRTRSLSLSHTHTHTHARTHTHTQHTHTHNTRTHTHAHARTHTDYFEHQNYSLRFY
jgi:ABC-type nickel/cobalt efflux system permease component RcnA